MKVLISTYGSAGDLFPLIPVATELIGAGHSIEWATPRAIGAYLRALGWRPAMLGDGSELRATSDSQLVTTRFGGWSSWRQTLVRYVLPTLASDIARVDDALRRWQPDIVLASGFAVAARAAALRAGYPLVECSIYPQHQRIRTDSRFGSDVREVLGDYLGTREPASLRRAMWGAPADVLMYEPSWLDRTFESAVGYPYWDDLPFSESLDRDVDRFIQEADRPVVAVCFGSFLGLGAEVDRSAVLALCGELGFAAVVTGPGSVGVRSSDSVFASAYLPLSRLLPKVSAVVHHGGLGTMMAAVRTATPAIILPRAFDQPFNCDRAVAAGVALDGRRWKMRDALHHVVKDGEIQAACRAIRGGLAPSSETVLRIRQVVEATAH